MSAHVKAHRRSLKECIKTLLSRRLAHRDTGNDHEPTVGSGTFTTRDPSLTLLPDLASVSSLPSFGSSRFDINNYSTETIVPMPRIPAKVWAADYFQEAVLLSAQPSFSQNHLHDIDPSPTSIAQLAMDCASHDKIIPRSPSNSTHLKKWCPDLAFDDDNDGLDENYPTSDTIGWRSPLAQLASTCHASAIYRQGASLQASLATLNSLKSCRRSASTLRLRVSSPDPKMTAKLQIPGALAMTDTSAAEHTKAHSPEQLRLRRSRSGIGSRSNSSGSTSPSAMTQESGRSSHQRVESEAGLTNVEHFRSFCVLDSASEGCSITAASRDLRYVFNVGDQFMINTRGIDGSDIDMCTGQDREGNTIIHLVIYRPLINPNSGRSRFTLACLLDITAFVQDAASLPDLETISEESTLEENIPTPGKAASDGSLSYDLCAEDLLGGCFVPEGFQTPVPLAKEDIWLDIATEETRRTRSLQSTPSAPRCSSTVTSAKCMDEILDRFLNTVQQLYSDFFVLGKSPLDECSYEICNVSPAVHASREYIEGHLSQTSLRDRQALERHLTFEEPFQVSVRWGLRGDPKRMYCTPLFGRSNITWACFLVDEHKFISLPTWSQPRG